jgi:hypothetical protein
LFGKDECPGPLQISTPPAYSIVLYQLLAQLEECRLGFLLEDFMDLVPLAITIGQVCRRGLGVLRKQTQRGVRHMGHRLDQHAVIHLQCREPRSAKYLGLR